MDNIQAGELLSKNLRAIYGYAYSKLYDKAEVEDLASEIVCEIIKASSNIKNEEAFWGDRNYYGGLFERKLPQAIVLSAYDAPMSAEELSMELGVSMPYLEEEIEILEAAGLIIKMGKKYQTNIVIMTDEKVPLCVWGVKK